ncbi:hypothetical protein [Cyanobium sp. N5-Cardenillas]|uniref:hypothetical protein n=1 Tax=Cyanobium sp. N5-Cardenillas TaxID=2823720 RepID=UPI0020CDB65B|nr:hypothetical protein [Cyanobium sp. N5-Cardenillas]MCP9786158.1 hypothetical protein [Cyanobium sp. N5-Cardenillas]
MVSSIAFAAGFAACDQRKGQLVPFLVEWPSLLAHLNPLELWRQVRTGRGKGGIELRRSAAALDAEFLESLALQRTGACTPPPEGTSATQRGGAGLGRKASTALAPSHPSGRKGSGPGSRGAGPQLPFSLRIG